MRARVWVLIRGNNHIVYAIASFCTGKHVLLRPAEDGLEPFVAQVVGHSSDDGVRQLKVRWYYR